MSEQVVSSEGQVAWRGGSTSPAHLARLCERGALEEEVRDWKAV